MPEISNSPKEFVPYTVTAEDFASITEPEVVFGTMRLLPNRESIPEQFYSRNVYTDTVDALFFGSPLPKGEVTFLPSFEDLAVIENINRAVRAHLASFGPKHQHKIAGIAYMMSMVCTITPGTDSE